MGDERRVSAITAGGLHFPVVRYFAYFITKCLLAREKVGALSSPDLAVLHRAIEGDNTYSLGAIVARRHHLNNSQGKIHGGIFATRLAAHFEVAIRPHDVPLTTVYLDRAAMEHHHFLTQDYPNIPIPYNLVFSVETRHIIPLPAPALFYSIARGGYRIMRADIIAYRNAQAAAEAAQEPQQWDESMPSPQHPYYYPGY